MLIDFSAPILSIDGTPLTNGDEQLTLRDMAVNALCEVIPGLDGKPELIDGATKVKNGSLALAIYDASESVDLEVEQVALIKDRIGKIYKPLGVMRAWNLLEGRT